MLRKSILYLALLATILCSSCDDFLTTPPPSLIPDSEWWKTKEQVIMMVNNCYSAELYGPDEVIYRDCLSDNGKRRDGTMPSVTAGTHDTQNSYIKGLWRYSSIARLNYVLEGIERSKDFIPADEFRQMRAQIRFIRAFVYYDMIFFFGDVPLITKTLTVSESRETSRQPRAEVLSFIIKELEEGVLPDIEAVPVTESGRVNANVVNAFLTRIYLFEKNYDKALLYANKVIDTKKYELFNDYEGLFRPQNDGKTKEIIFERQYSAPLYVTEINRNLSPVSSVYAGWSHVSALQELVDEYECINGHKFSECEKSGCPYVEKRKEVESPIVRGEYQFRDPRLQASIMYPFWEWKQDGKVVSRYGVDDPNSVDYVKKETFMTGFLVAKWLDLEGQNADRLRSDKNLTIIRYADILLMKAESLIEKNQDLSQAVSILNEIRTRAGMPANIQLTNQDDLREKLRHERRIELAFEGLRYYDIIRWRIAEKVKKGKVYGARMKAVNDNMDNKLVEERYWENKMYLFPIPQSARDLNPNLTQNSDW